MDVYGTASEQGDITFTDRLVDPAQEPRALSQQIHTAINTGQGEYVWDIFVGVDWIGYLTQKDVDVFAMALDVRQQIENVPSVSSCTVVEATKAERRASLVFDVLFAGQEARLALRFDPLALREVPGQDRLVIPLTIIAGAGKAKIG